MIVFQRLARKTGNYHTYKSNDGISEGEKDEPEGYLALCGCFKSGWFEWVVVAVVTGITPKLDPSRIVFLISGLHVAE